MSDHAKLNGTAGNGHTITSKNGSEQTQNNGRKREDHPFSKGDVHPSPFSGRGAGGEGQTTEQYPLGAACDFDPLDEDFVPQDYKVGPGNPPKEHQFKPGNPGGPGRPRGSKSMRKLIQDAVFDQSQNNYFAKAIVGTLLIEAVNGNTHAIRIVCEHLRNNKRKGATLRS